MTVRREIVRDQPHLFRVVECEGGPVGRLLAAKVSIWYKKRRVKSRLQHCGVVQATYPKGGDEKEMK